MYALLQHCNYGILEDERIRERIVVGIKNSRLSQKLQLDPELTFEKSVMQVRQKEAVLKQQTALREDVRKISSNSIDGVNKSALRYKLSSNKDNRNPNRPKGNSNSCKQANHSQINKPCSRSGNKFSIIEVSDQRVIPSAINATVEVISKNSVKHKFMQLAY